VSFSGDYSIGYHSFTSQKYLSQLLGKIGIHFEHIRFHNESFQQRSLCHYVVRLNRGSNGTRQKEATYINKSLLTLGHVVYKLAEISMKKDKEGGGNGLVDTTHIWSC